MSSDRKLVTEVTCEHEMQHANIYLTVKDVNTKAIICKESNQGGSL